MPFDHFSEARKPAFKSAIDFGDFCLKKSSAQITTQCYIISDRVRILEV